MNLLWLTDLHLDCSSAETKAAFRETLRASACDAAVITGDISDARRLRDDLLFLAETLRPKPVYFVLGNHDYFWSSFAAVDAMVAQLAASEAGSNLRPLGFGEIVPLSETDALIGHRGWADGRAGLGERSRVKLESVKESKAIDELRSASEREFFEKLSLLGKESADYFSRVLPEALDRFERVWVATHFPPFPEAALFDGQVCDENRLPHFVNVAAGEALRRAASKRLDRRLAVLCGHTHCAAVVEIESNLSAFAGSAQRGKPRIAHAFPVR